MLNEAAIFSSITEHSWTRNDSKCLCSFPQNILSRYRNRLYASLVGSHRVSVLYLHMNFKSHIQYLQKFPMHWNFFTIFETFLWIITFSFRFLLLAVNPNTNFLSRSRSSQTSVILIFGKCITMFFNFYVTSYFHEIETTEIPFWTNRVVWEWNLNTQNYTLKYSGVRSRLNTFFGGSYKFSLLSKIIFLKPCQSL